MVLSFVMVVFTKLQKCLRFLQYIRTLNEIWPEKHLSFDTQVSSSTRRFLITDIPFISFLVFNYFSQSTFNQTCNIYILCFKTTELRSVKLCRNIPPLSSDDITFIKRKSVNFYHTTQCQKLPTLLYRQEE